MARVTIVFEDVDSTNDDGRTVSIALASDCMPDSERDPTPAELTAQNFYGFLVAASSSQDDQVQE